MRMRQIKIESNAYEQISFVLNHSPTVLFGYANFIGMAVKGGPIKGHESCYQDVPNFIKDILDLAGQKNSCQGNVQERHGVELVRLKEFPKVPLGR